VRAKDKIEAVAREYESVFGHYHGGLIDAYATEDAEVIMVAMGSTVGTLREAVDVLRTEGIKIGLVKVRCFRPFPGEALRQALGRTGAIAVFDRAISLGFQGVLATEVKAALYDAPKDQRPLVLGMMAGFGGREVTLDSVREIVNRSRRALDAGRVPADEAQFIGLKPELLPAQERGDRARTV
jgi:pyruvate ferredoxin oxidoreductase alpha subunit